MDISRLGSKLRPLDTSAMPDAQWVRVVRKAKELQRMCNLKFDCASFGIGEVAKAVLCLDLASSLAGCRLARNQCVKSSGLSDKAYTHALSTMQNALGVRPQIDIRELAIQFGCVRVVEVARKNLNEFVEKFKSSLPVERRAAADLTRPVFVVSALYLTARKQQLKMDRHKLSEVTGTSEGELQRVTGQMQDMCPRLFGPAPAQAREKTRKRQAGEGEEGTDGVEAQEGGEEERREREWSFEEWKRRVREGSSSKTDGDTRRKVKQARLAFTSSSGTKTNAVEIS